MLSEDLPAFTTKLMQSLIWFIQSFKSNITKEKLVEIIKGLLGTHADLNFLVKLDVELIVFLMYVHYKSSFRDDGTKTRWIVNINVIRMNLSY